MSLEEKRDKIRSNFIEEWESSSDHVKLLFGLEMNKIDSFHDRKGFLEDIINSHSELKISFLYNEKKYQKNILVIFIIYIISMYFSYSNFQQILFSTIFIFISINNFWMNYKIHNHISYIRNKRCESEDELKYYKDFVFQNLPKFYNKEEILDKYPQFETEYFNVYWNLEIEKYEYLLDKLINIRENFRDGIFH